jgi:uncharacterized protein (DUF2141 family)
MANSFYLTVAALAVLASSAAAQAMGGDAAACAAGAPSIRVDVTGLKDRTGRLKVELYPANEADFLRDDRELVAAGKTFRRVWAQVPASGPVALCIRVPHPGAYAVFFTHDRDGKNKFNFWSDGAGTPGNHRLGRARPRLADAVVTVGARTATVAIRTQYLRGFPPGFDFLKD